MRMLVAGVHLPDTILQSQLAASSWELLSGSDPLYNQLASQTAQAAGRINNPERQATTSLMPIAYFGIRTAVQIAQEPEIAPLLPAQVERRAAVIGHCSNIAIARALDMGQLADYYSTNRDLNPLFSQKNRIIAKFVASKSTYAAEVLKLGDVAIMDHGIVAGGALRLLQRKHRDALQAEPAAAIVGRSVGLQLVARVPDDDLDTMRIRLGSPYTNPNYLTFARGVVDFTAEARTFLHGLMKPGKGCPAHTALTEGAGAEPTYLRLAWADLSSALLPPHAKAEAPPQKRQPERKSKKR